VRGQLVAALRASDAAWAALSHDEKRRLLRAMKHGGFEPRANGGGASPKQSERSMCATCSAAPSFPWTAVGRVLLVEVWAALHLGLGSFILERVERVLRHRWKNDLGGGDYSTGLTDVTSNDTRPTWIEERRVVWRDFDERVLLAD